MASRMWKFTRCLDTGHVTLAGNFALDSSGNPSALVFNGAFSVTKTGTGQYTILMRDSYKTYLAGSAHLLESTLTALNAVVTGITTGTVNGKTVTAIVITIKSAAVATDVTNACTMVIRVDLKNSDIT